MYPPKKGITVMSLHLCGFLRKGETSNYYVYFFEKGRKAKNIRNFREVKVAMYINHLQDSSYPVGIGAVGLMVLVSVCPQQSPQ